MRFPPSEEVRVLGLIAEHPDDHLDFPFYDYHRGRIIISRDNRSTSLHRWLYTATTGEVLDADDYLLRTCDDEWCQNPRHHVVHNAPRLPSPAQVKLGPPRPSRPQILAARTHCPQGHEYTRENTYVHTQRDGYRRRSCKTCRRQRAAEQRRNRR